MASRAETALALRRVGGPTDVPDTNGRSQVDKALGGWRLSARGGVRSTSSSNQLTPTRNAVAALTSELVASIRATATRLKPLTLAQGRLACRQSDDSRRERRS